MKLAILIIASMFALDVFAFNSSKCSNYTAKGNPVEGMFRTIFSTTSFISSTGECALIGFLGQDSKMYIAHNAEFLQIDIARGAGEYLHNFANISKCNESKLRPLLKKNYQRIFSSDDLNPEAIYKKIDDVIRENNQTGDLCSVGVS